jgi:hypothetical protein
MPAPQVVFAPWACHRECTHLIGKVEMKEGSRGIAKDDNCLLVGSPLVNLQWMSDRDNYHKAQMMRKPR